LENDSKFKEGLDNFYGEGTVFNEIAQAEKAAIIPEENEPLVVAERELAELENLNG
jgi:hypothetical protein